MRFSILSSSFLLVDSKSLILFSLVSLIDLRLEVSSSKDLGENVEIKTHRDGSHYLYLEDPDGNVLEKIYWDR